MELEGGAKIVYFAMKDVWGDAVVMVRVDFLYLGYGFE